MLVTRHSSLVTFFSVLVTRHSSLVTLLLLLAVVGVATRHPAPGGFIADAVAAAVTPAVAEDEVLKARRLGQAYYEDGKYKEAAEQFRRVLQLQPREASWADHFNLGLALIGIPDETAALAALETARQVQPNAPGPLYGLGVLYKHQGRFGESFDFFERAIKAGANDMATFFNAGAVLMSAGRSKEALDHFQKVLEKGFDTGPGWYLASQYRISRLLLKLGRGEEAAQALRDWESRRKAMKDPPSDTPATLELGPLAQPHVPTRPMPAQPDVAAPVFVRARSVPARRTPARVKTVRFDYDVDGDVDELSVPTACGPLMLKRNNGNKTFTDVTGEAQLALPAGQRACDVTVTDIDGDTDLDIVAAGPDGAWLFENVRGGKFRRTAPFGKASGTQVAAADLNSDGAFDVVFASENSLSVWWNRSRELRPLDGARAPFVLADLNGDGLLDLAWGAADSVQFLLNRGARQFQPLAGPKVAGVAALAGRYASPPRNSFLLEVTTKARQITFRRTAPRSRWLRLELEGSRSNKAGVGAIVEVKAGDFYIQRQVTDGPTVIETGVLEHVNVVRVAWPNGILQNAIETKTNRVIPFSEQDRLASSCPLLYLWDGQQWVFFAEVLSRTPLGEPDGQGGFILPGSGEPVFLAGEKVVMKDGRFVFQLTEELREAIYIDRARLIALDHPAGTRAFVDEAYRGTPAESRPVVLKGVERIAMRRGPARAREDRLPGLMERYATYLTLPAGADHLVMRGWTYWMDSNVATAAAQDPARAAVFPRLEALRPDGAWETVVEDFGLPSGAGRHVLADLRAWREQRPRAGATPMRIVTNLRVTWEEALAGSYAGSPRQTELPLAAADLHYRGFSEPTISPTRGAPDWYDYSRLMRVAPWNPLPGRYTRYGDVAPLLANADDRLAVIGAGDELTVEFDPVPLPPLAAGWERDFVLDLAGWAKAGETNTASSASNEPMPYRGMKQYPYQPDSVPGWQRAWLTRRPMPHFPPLAPAR